MKLYSKSRPNIHDIINRSAQRIFGMNGEMKFDQIIGNTSLILNKTKCRKFFAALRLTAAAAAITTALFAPMSGFADVLGTHTGHSSTELAQGTTLVTNTFENPDVGRQTEHYVSYTPNLDVVPIVTNGASIYGKRTVAQAYNFLQDRGVWSAMGMNADFFSFQTGVPMSNVIIDRKVVSKDSDWRPAIGFRGDGTAFIAQLPVNTFISTDEGSFMVECINKYRQPYALYLYTNDFADNTHSPGSGIDVVLGSVSGDITLNSEITAVVEEVASHDGSVPIPDGKLVLSVAQNASQELKDRLNILQPGKTVTISTIEAIGDERWNDVQYALGCMGGTLVTNGQLNVEDESAAPRTAVGIRGDGSIVFYTIDGRQSGYSYGVRKETLARRMLELGCVDAINLDGGGSTSIGGVYPGAWDFTLFNSPSDGGLRSCANFLFLRKMNAPSGIADWINLSSYGTNILSGSSMQITVEGARDSAYYPADPPASVEYYIEKDADTPSESGLPSTVTPEGYVTVQGNGDVYVAAKSGEAYGSTMVRTITTPDSIDMYNAGSGEAVQRLDMNPGDSIYLAANAYWGGAPLVSQNTSFRWTAVSDGASIGTIDANGFFVASQNGGATGLVAVSAGTCSYEVPVTIHGGGSTIPSSYPTIVGEINSDSFTAQVSSQNGSIAAYDISLSADGQKVNFQYASASGTVVYPVAKEFANTYHRITLCVKDETGAAVIKTFDTGDISSIPNAFGDTQGHWARTIVSYLTSLKIVNGSPDDNGVMQFLPDNNMTRTEFAVMLTNYLHLDPAAYEDVVLPFIDAGDIPWWAVNHVKAVYDKGLMKGQLTDYGVRFNPYANIQRLEYAISLSRLLPEGLSQSPITAADQDQVPWWAEESMKTAIAQGIMNGYPDGTLKPTQSVTRAEAVKMLYAVLGAGVE